MKFCFKLRKTATETHKICFGDETIFYMCVFYFFKIFREGLEDLENVPRIQWPSAAHNPETVTKVYELLAETIKLP